jgi:hypothetical protein
MLIVEKLLKGQLNNITILARSQRLKYFPCQFFFHYYKIQHGGKNPMLVSKAIIIFTMEIMHK